MIKHIFFDLDNTLWDFNTNSRKTLLELISNFRLKEKGVVNSESFIEKYQIHNEYLWSLYRDDKITKEKLRSERFLLTLKDYNIDDPTLADKFGNAYVRESPIKKQLFPFAIKTLNYLKDQYSLHIITNGFEEVQHIKLENCGLIKYFNHIITSEKVGVKKPNREIFEYALEQANTNPKESIMIGDDLQVDIIAAQDLKIKGIYFNPTKKKVRERNITEISCLSELIKIL